ncbi:hypothetical protein M231_07139 [Tremella mesenterica]|uniref:Uncharacterized protein n=2 Tax=Tremella mesenterica TaxID=5217 RepID=A0A4Q1BA20_TREME|nr:hypothetical protein M231_07139 [Tremella mesenterica]
MRLNYNKDKRRVRYFTDSALSSAGVKKIVDDVNGTIESLKELSEGKKEKVVQKSKEKDNGGRRRKVKVPMVEGSDHHGFLELVVDGNKVFLPQEDGSMTPLSTLTTPPSIWRTWPIQFSLFLARKTSSHLPSSLQDKLPLSIRPQPEIEVESEDESEIDTPTKGRVKTMRRSATPRDTPTTEESDDVEGKKKKHGVGKASAARRRKMAMKR